MSTGLAPAQLTWDQLPLNPGLRPGLRHTLRVQNILICRKHVFDGELSTTGSDYIITWSKT